jgi:hypothetical protein
MLIKMKNEIKMDGKSFWHRDDAFDGRQEVKVVFKEVL